MISGKQILWGTLGWAFGGPIGGILGVIFAGSNDQGTYKQVKQSQAVILWYHCLFFCGNGRW